MNELQMSIMHYMTYNAVLIIVVGTAIGLSRFFFVGTKKFTYDSILPGQPHGPKWYASLNRVYINGIEAMTLFAPMALFHVLTSSHLEGIAKVAGAFLIGRILYSIVYLLGGYKIWCSFCWLIGFVATLIGWLLILV